MCGWWAENVYQKCHNKKSDDGLVEEQLYFSALYARVQ